MNTTMHAPTRGQLNLATSALLETLRRTQAPTDVVSALRELYLTCGKAIAEGNRDLAQAVYEQIVFSFVDYELSAAKMLSTGLGNGTILMAA